MSSQQPIVIRILTCSEYNTKADPDCEQQEGAVVCAPPVQDITHENFSVKQDNYDNNNDVGLIRLAFAANFNDYVKPACLPFHYPKVVDSGGETGYAAGWGYQKINDVGEIPTLENSSFPITLRAVALRIWTHDSCKNHFLVDKNKYKVTDGQICAGGDGGPLMWSNVTSADQYFLMGITSFGPGCGLGKPGVFTNVSYYIPWILQHMTE